LAKVLYSLIIFSFFVGIYQLITLITFDFTIFAKVITPAYLFLILIPSLKIIQFNLSRKRSAAPKALVVESGAGNKSLPDIYYIIVDGYLNSKLLREFFNFDNSSFCQSLKAKGFQIGEDSRSNYPLTNLSLSSSLNMNYIDTFFDCKNITSSEDGLQKLYKHHLKNKVMLELKKLGYKYVHIVNHWEQMYFDVDADADVEIKCGASVDFLRIFLHKTLVGIYENNLFAAASRKNMKFLLESLKSCCSIGGPKFVFSHLICPHEPYLFNKNGDKPRSYSNKDAHKKENVELYLDQISYLNSQLLQIVDNITKNSSTKPIIVIQADHGSEFLLYQKSALAADGVPIWPQDASGEMLQERFGIFNAVYLPNNENIFAQIKTPVNTFRFIFNKYFSANYKILPEKQYFCNYKDHFNLVEVTKNL